MAMSIEKRVKDLSSRLEVFQSKLPRRKDLDKFDNDFHEARITLDRVIRKLDKCFLSYQLSYSVIADNKDKQQQALQNSLESRQTKICF